MGDLSMLFTVAAEFPVEITGEQVSAALAAVQDRHPLLQVHIEDHPEGRLGFHRPAPVPPISLRVLHRPAETWRQVAAEEVSQQFDTSQAPLARAVLVGDGDRSALLLTFYHCVVDGIGGVAVLNDLVSALNGQELEILPIPPSQEDVVAGTLTAPTGHEAGPPPADDPRMGVPVAPRPLDGATPSVATLALDKELTRNLLLRSREEKTTVHSILVAAVSRARRASWAVRSSCAC
ncbi:condensation domain-containing protein [Streptomyces sp. NPDC088794]|uniref:condensation domain-containing protein n=1 Tax=Streptomyces sp. NPDC088794 TaxID=3365902 RepID=UPI0038113B89